MKKKLFILAVLLCTPIFFSSASTNIPPVAVADWDYSAVTYQSLQYYGVSSHDPDGTIASYRWNFGDGSTSSLENPIHAFTVAGVYTVRLTVTDNKGLTNSATAIATITPDKLPVASAGPAVSGFVNQSVHFDGSASYDPDGDVLEYSWDLGNGTIMGGPTLSTLDYVYPVAGTYKVVLTVSDPAGLRTSAGTTATISKPVADTVTITSATWSKSTKVLTVVGKTTAPNGSATLTVVGQGTMTYVASTHNYTLTKVLKTSPATIKVTSNFGGAATAIVKTVN